jgi:hypothetical protein
MILGEGAAVCCLELGKKKMHWLSSKKNWLCYRNFGTQYIYFGRSYLFQKIDENGFKGY